MIMLANGNTAIHERLWCVYEAHLAHGLDISVEIAGEPMYLLTGDLQDTLRKSLEAAQAAEREQKGKARKSAVDGTVLTRLRAAKAKVDEAKRAVLDASDGELINLDTAKCTYEETDGVMIRAAIAGAKEGITHLLARLIRDVVKVESPELAGTSRMQAAARQLQDAEPSQSSPSSSERKRTVPRPRAKPTLSGDGDLVMGRGRAETPPKLTDIPAVPASTPQPPTPPPPEPVILQTSASRESAASSSAAGRPLVATR